MQTITVMIGTLAVELSGEDEAVIVAAVAIKLGATDTVTLVPRTA